jgi:hypothetical protein
MSSEPPIEFEHCKKCELPLATGAKECPVCGYKPKALASMGRRAIRTLLEVAVVGVVIVFVAKALFGVFLVLSILYIILRLIFR